MFPFLLFFFFEYKQCHDAYPWIFVRMPSSNFKEPGEDLREGKGFVQDKKKNLVTSDPANVSPAGRPHFKAVCLPQACFSVHPGKTCPHMLLSPLAPHSCRLNLCKRISGQLFSWIHTKGLR